MSVSKQEIPSTKGKRTKKLILVIAILNIVDAISTWILVKKGWAFEVNPIMDALLDKGPLAFFLVKVGVGSGILAYLSWRVPAHKAQKYFCPIFAILILYGVINALHILSFMFGLYIE